MLNGFQNGTHRSVPGLRTAALYSGRFQLPLRYVTCCSLQRWIFKINGHV